MLRHYLVTTLNNLLKHKQFGIINIAGLAIGLAACLLIVLYVRQESAYDKHWSNSERLYRVNTAFDPAGGTARVTGGTSMLALDALKSWFPEEIEYATRVRGVSKEVRVAEQRFENAVVSVDADIANMLDIDVLDGDLAYTLGDPRSIALSEELAHLYFGSADVVGRELVVVRSVSQTESVPESFRVGAVYRVPAATVLELPAMVMLDEATFDAFTFGNWMTLDFTTLVQLRHGVDAQEMVGRLEDFTKAQVTLPGIDLGPDGDPSSRVRFDLQNIATIYLDDSIVDSYSGGDRTQVIAFSAIAALVLLIGCLNFTILSTAKAAQRAREVAMRKTMGAGRGELLAQFLGESFFLVIPALVLALMLVELLLPAFEMLVDRSLSVDYSSAATWASLLLLVTATGFAGGLYPALVQSWFLPASTLKGTRLADSRSAFGLGSALVVFQFSIAIALMVATAVILLQVEYSAKRDAGFDGENILVLDNLNRRSEVSSSKAVLKQELAALPEVQAVTLSAHQPTQTTGYVTLTMPYTLAGGIGVAQPVATMSVDHDFFDTYGISLLAGRNYDAARDRPTPLFQGGYQSSEGNSESNVVINAGTARLLGFGEPQAALGQRLVNTRGFNGVLHNFTIIGVVADTQFYSLRSAPRPEIYVLSPQYMTDVISVRYSGDPQQVLERIAGVWQRVVGGEELSVGSVAQNMSAEFAQERVEARLLVSFSILAIVIAGMGLYGSAAFAVEKRTREIGIRKVLGAEVREIVTMLVWQFSRPVLLANAIAWPLAAWSMLVWLQRFPYRIDALVLVPLCVLAGAVALSIAWLTVAGNTMRVASTKPVLALRYE